MWSRRPGSVRQALRRFGGQPVRASMIRKATGAIVHRSPRSTKDTVKTIAQGRPGDRQHLSSTPCALLSHTRDFGCPPAPGLPCALASDKGGKG
nr:hypothetical protein BDOA9_0122730 [Bradyrhizobium sp. DOA9]